MWEMQLWMQTKQKSWGKSDRVPSLVIKTAASLRLFFGLGKLFFFPVGVGGVGASPRLQSTNTQSCSKEMREIHEPSLPALLSLLSSPPRYQMPCLFLQRWSRRPIWMCCSSPHLLSLSFTAWYLPSGVGGGV